MVPDVIADDAQVSEVSEGAQVSEVADGAQGAQVFQWEDAVVYFASVDRFSDGASQHDEVSGVAWEAQCQGSWVGNHWEPGAHAQPTDAAPHERLALAFGLNFTNRGVPLVNAATRSASLAAAPRTIAA